MKNPLRLSVYAIDALIRKLSKVEEFTDDADCILRFSLVTSPTRAKVSDGIEVEAGQPLVELHLWNEHIPVMPPEGPDLEWGEKFLKKLRYSLHLLADYIRQEPRLREAEFLKGEMAFPKVKEKQFEELINRLGFVLDSREPKGIWEHFAEFWENFYSWALIWAFNPASLKKKSLLGMRRYRLWMRKEELLRRYGREGAPSVQGRNQHIESITRIPARGGETK